MCIRLWTLVDAMKHETWPSSPYIFFLLKTCGMSKDWRWRLVCSDCVGLCVVYNLWLYVQVLAR
jgi:hypothetical protein